MLLDTDGMLVDTEHASTLAWRGADATSELGEVVRHKQAVECAPLVLEHEVVPLGDGL